MNWLRRIFRRKKADLVYVQFGGGKPLKVPTCPYGCGLTLRNVVMAGGVVDEIKFPRWSACEHEEEALRRALFDRDYEQLYDANRDEWITYPRR